VEKLKVEIRADNTVCIEGYVNAVGRDSRILPSPHGKFVEQIEPKTFQRALENAQDVELKHNHKRVIGSKSNGTLELYEDNIGLYARAIVNDEIIVEKAKAKELRTLRGFKLNEVSIIDSDLTPCYVGTSIEVRGEENIICETRSNDDVVVTADTKTVTTVTTTRQDEYSETQRTAIYENAEKTIEIIKLRRPFI